MPANTDASGVPRTTLPVWRTGDVTWYVLATGLAALIAIVFGLAALGGWGGIVAIAVVMAAVIALLATWANAPQPPDAD